MGLATFVLLILAEGPVRADAPPGYYAATSGLSGAALRQAIHDIIDDHQRYPYTSTATDTWDILAEADEDPGDAARIVTIYKNESIPESDHSQSSGWNREHSWPSSYGFPNDNSCNYPHSDAHHLFAAEWSYNGARGNRVFDWCSSGCTEYPVDGLPFSNWGDGSGSTGSWQVRDDRRGDLARALLYMDLRYEGGQHGVTGCDEPDLVLTDDRGLIVSDSSTNQSVAYMGVLAVLLEWHLEDPVDQLERDRNDTIFGYQGNRSPFVDHPEWVCDLYGCAGDTTAPAAPTGVSAVAGDCEVAVAWADNAEGDLAGYDVLRSETPGGSATIVNGAVLFESQYTDTSVVADSTYFYTVVAHDTAGNTSDSSAEVSVTTGSCGGGPSAEPWINEIHYDNQGQDTGEGIEIAGPAGTSLSGWQLLGYNGNGGGIYQTHNLSGTIGDQQGGFGTVWFAFPGLQNGARDGVALVDDSGFVVEFVSYEGSLTATSGVAAGLTSVDIGVAESSSTSSSLSLQRVGTGSEAGDFAWQSPSASSKGSPNSGQLFEGGAPPDTSAPSVPIGLSALSAEGSVSLDWFDNSEVDLAGYDVHRSVTSGGPYSRVNGSLLTFSDYVDTEVVNGVTYYYIVTAWDTAGNESDGSVQVSATPADLTPPSAPTGLVANPGDSTVTLDWTGNGETDLGGYDVYRSATPGGPYSQVNGSLVLASTFTESGLVNGITYYYVVTATDSAGNESGVSAEASATPTAPPPGPVLALEAGVANGVDEVGVTVTLQNSYFSPVVVCTVHYANNLWPVVVRVSNVTSDSFALRLQSTGDLSVVAAESVHYIVVEEGSWTLPDGTPIEAHRFTSTVTDENNSWVGEALAYGQSYTDPVVLGQVMSENDAKWSVFWCRGTGRSAPPSPSTLRVGKTVCEDFVVTRADETLGVIVVEQSNGSLLGVSYEARLGSDSIRGVGNSPPYRYSFATAFGSAPQVGIVTQAAMDGGNGGWAYLYGASPLGAGWMDLAIEEDHIKDSERRHSTEQVGYLVFEGVIVYSD